MEIHREKEKVCVKGLLCNDEIGCSLEIALLLLRDWNERLFSSPIVENRGDHIDIT